MTSSDGRNLLWDTYYTVGFQQHLKFSFKLTFKIFPFMFSGCEQRLDPIFPVRKES